VNKTVWIDLSLHKWSSVVVDENPADCPVPGSVGFLMVFDDYPSALEWANGDASRIAARHAGLHETSQEENSE